jgi:hypothetical protein
MLQATIGPLQLNDGIQISRRVWIQAFAHGPVKGEQLEQGHVKR